MEKELNVLPALLPPRYMGADWVHAPLAGVKPGPEVVRFVPEMRKGQFVTDPTT
jgi:hypothetical protein